MVTDQHGAPGDQIEVTRRRILLLTNVFPSPWLPTKGTFNFELARSVARRHTLRVINPISDKTEDTLRTKPKTPFVYLGRHPSVSLAEDTLRYLLPFGISCFGISWSGGIRP